MRTRSLLAALGVLAILLVITGWFDKAPDQPGSTGPTARPPAVSITVDNGHTTARPGDVVTYTTRVRNQDHGPLRLTVSQMLPAALDVVRTSPDGLDNPRRIRWDVSLAAGETAKLTATTRVLEPRAGYSRLTTTSCVARAAGAPSSATSTDTMSGRDWFTCARDSDRMSLTGAVAPTNGRLLLLGGLALVIAIGIVAATTAVRDQRIGRAVATTSRRTSAADDAVGDRQASRTWSRPGHWSGWACGRSRIGSSASVVVFRPLPAPILALGARNLGTCRVGNARDPPIGRAALSQRAPPVDGTS